MVHAFQKGPANVFSIIIIIMHIIFKRKKKPCLYSTHVYYIILVQNYLNDSLYLCSEKFLKYIFNKIYRVLG